VVDVRDLAEAHYQAGFKPEAKGRYIISGHNTDMLSMAKSLASKYGDHYPLPKMQLPKFMVWLVGPLMNKAMTRTMISKNVGIPFKADHSKSVRELGVSYRSLESSMTEFFQQLIDSDQIPAK